MYKSDTSPAWVYCANGLYFKARCFSGKGTRIGEIVFNTSLSGYQEIITDPSYAGQFVVFSMPEIGIVGANELDSESRGIFSSGMIVRHYENFISNFRATQSLKTFLDKHNTLGICDVDTRALVKMIRTQGAMMSIISTEISDKKILAKTLESAPDITAQNHIYSVPEAIANIADITHRNLFDNTIEGVAYKDAPIFSVQHHPEASPGPRESRNIFERFAQIIHQTHKKRTAST